ncbi:11213_t:CDS:2 [Racocetra fulgida]|uniref:11213_t:CDS:1 n=1 Tax=Racocetra fulgida TaxID=60492 RepID=A0A9N9BE48_9GLOM|nr:11213_t:CDS:2 [Racocetra fulgida]
MIFENSLINTAGNDNIFGKKLSLLTSNTISVLITVNYISVMGLDLDACISQLLQKQLLDESLLKEICEKTKELLMRESNVIHISAPVTVVGDIHG